MAEKRNSEGSEIAESQSKRVCPISRTREVPRRRGKREDGYYGEYCNHFHAINERYTIFDELHISDFSQVFDSVDKMDESGVAIKIWRAFERVFDEKEGLFVEKESVFAEKAKHEVNILEYLARIKTEKTRFVEMLDWFRDGGGEVCIVFERLGPSLFKELKKKDFSPFPLDQIQEFGEQILESVACMHKNGLMHTNLKSDNVLLVSRCYQVVFGGSPMDKPKSNDIKVIGFSDAINFNVTTQVPIESLMNNRAPEVILGLGGSYPCDMWSMGCLLFELSTGSLGFKTENNLEYLAIMERVLGPLPEPMVQKAKVPVEYFSQCRVNLREVSAESRSFIESHSTLEELVSGLVESSKSSSFVDLLHGLMRYDPKERLTAQSALAHPFFKKNRKLIKTNMRKKNTSNKSL